MKIKLLVSVIASIVLLACQLCQLGLAQDKKQYTNADVIKMVKAGVDESVVIAAIQSNPASYDMSPEALIELKKEGVSAKVQAAMIAAGTGKPAPPVPGAPNPGQGQVAMYHAFLIDGTQRIEMKQNKGEIDSVAAPFFAKVYTKFGGRQAEFRITNSMPVFEVALPGNQVAHEHVKLVKPDVKKDKRELTIQGVAGPGVPIKPDKKANVAITVEEVRREGGAGFQTGVHRVKPSNPLPAGEYVLIIDHIYYCFGVDAKK